MKRVLNAILILFWIVYCQASAEITERNQFDQSDSSAIYDLVRELQGIEFYFVFDQDFERMGANLRTLLEFKQDSIPPLLQKYEPQYRITSINRIMTLECRNCENSIRLTYWNVSDGSVLMATVSTGCGPVCSDHINFTVYKNGEKSHIERESVLPTVRVADYLGNPADSASIKGAVYGFTFSLPNEGDKILICLNLEEPNQNREFLMVDCLCFFWEDGKFVFRGI